jgi:hypothetical protein
MMNNMRTYLDILNEQNAKKDAESGLTEAVQTAIANMGLGTFLIELGKSQVLREEEKKNKVVKGLLKRAALGTLLGIAAHGAQSLAGHRSNSPMDQDGPNAGYERSYEDTHDYGDVDASRPASQD